MKVFYSQGDHTEPQPISYQPLAKTGHAYVRLSHDITWDEKEDCYTADEVAFETELSYEDVVKNEDVLFKNGGSIPDGTPTVEDRLAAMEEAMLYIGEVIG